MVDIDKILLEWSWRCEKGYPDLNTAKDLGSCKAVNRALFLMYNWLSMRSYFIVSDLKFKKG